MENQIIRFMSLFLQRNLEVSLVIFFVVVARLFMKKLPRKYSFLLWGIVGIRMMFQIPLQASFSIFAWLPRQVRNQKFDIIGEVQTDEIMQAINQGTGKAMSEATAQYGAGTMKVMNMSIFTEKIFLLVLAGIWAIGLISLIVYAVIDYRYYQKKVQFAVKTKDGIWECDHLSTPFVMGIIRPRIYVPFHLKEEERAYIIAHEKYHIKRKDMISKSIAYVLLMIYWINPLCWIAFKLMNIDMEMSCDEAVLTRFGSEIKENYSSSLLSFATVYPRVNFAPLAFGESDASKRIKNVLNYKKKGVVAAVMGMIAVIAISAICLTNQSKQDTIAVEDEKNAVALTDQKEIRDEQSAVTDAITAKQTPEEKEAVEKMLSKLQQQYQLSDSQVSLYQYVLSYAQAFADRDGVQVASMINDSTRKSMLERNFFWDENKNEGFGWSSPWPWGQKQFDLISVSDNEAEIHYYAVVSDPHVTVWIEKLQYEYDENHFLILNETLDQMEAITSKEEFDKAYPQGITDSFMNYGTNQMGEYLNMHAVKRDNPEAYDKLFTPEQAAEVLLNLSSEKGEIEYKTSPIKEYNNVCSIQITFVKDQSQITLYMCQPFGADGIWIPEDQLNSSALDGVRQTGKVNTDVLKVRKEAQPEAEVVAFLEQESEVAIIGTQDDFYEISVYDKENEDILFGFVKQEFITLNK